MDRLERLVNLVAALLDAERPLSREQLRLRVAGYTGEGETFRRTFERDKDLLRQMGLPLVLEPLNPDVPDGPAGYRIPPERYQLPDPGLADDELAALRLAANAVQIQGAWGQPATTSALWKLAGASPGGGAPSVAAGLGATGHGATSVPLAGEGRDPVPVVRALALAELPAADGLAVLFGAVAERQAVRFSYRGEPRTIDPWRLSFRNGQWYLSGWDHDREAERLFRLDRVDGGVHGVGSSGAFARPVTASAGPPPPWRLGDDEEVTAVVLVDADQAEWAVAVAGPEDDVERRGDGSALLHLRVTNREALRSWVLGFLDHAEILGPADIRAEFMDWLEVISTAGDRSSRGSA